MIPWTACGVPEVGMAPPQDARNGRAAPGGRRTRCAVADPRDPVARGGRIAVERAMIPAPIHAPRASGA
jgi:hypothetical protein